MLSCYEKQLEIPSLGKVQSVICTHFPSNVLLASPGVANSSKLSSSLGVREDALNFVKYGKKGYYSNSNGVIRIQRSDIILNTISHNRMPTRMPECQ